MTNKKFTQPEIDHLADRFYTMFYDETPATKESGYALIESMYETFASLHDDYSDDELLEVYRQVFRPLKNQVAEAFADAK